jgi:hypothetical protein
MLCGTGMDSENSALPKVPLLPDAIGISQFLCILGNRRKTE